MRVKTLALMMTGAFCLPVLSIAAAAPVQAQAVPRQLPDEPLPELPSVSEYSLPPGDDQTPTDSGVQGPVEENSPPPQPATEPNDTQSGTQPAVSPVPVSPTPTPTPTPTPRTTTNPADSDRDQPAQNQPAPVDDAQPETTTSPAQSAPSTDGEQPQPDETTSLPDQVPSADQSVAGDATETARPADSQTDGSGTNGLYYFGGGLVFLLLAGLGFYFWRRRTSASLSKGAVMEDSAPAPGPKPVAEPRKPAPKIYSPPNPAGTRKPAATSPDGTSSAGTSSDGFVTSKIGMAPDRQPAPKAIPPVAPPIPQAPTPRPNFAAESTLADHLRVEFVANAASSTLLNAVLNYTVTLTNISDQDLSDIRLSGAMMQADTENARNGAAQSGDLLHITETLSAGDTVTLTGDIRTPLNTIRPITFKLQALFIPLAHFGVEYRDAAGSAHQQRSSFIIGREYEPPRDKMAPFRLDLGPRNFGPVGQRPLLTS